MTAEQVPEKGPGAGSARTLVRGLTLLEIVAALPQGGAVTEIAHAAGLDKGTTSRLLATLRKQGYVRQRPADRRYFLNGKLLALARGYDAQLDLREVARPHLTALGAATGETVHLAVREGRQVVFVDQIEPDGPIRLKSVQGSSLPLHVTAMGRAILAALPAEEREPLVAQLVADHRFRDLVVDLDRLPEAIAEAGARGWAAVERDDDVCRVGAAILDATGIPVGAVSVSGPAYRMRERVAQCGASCVATARTVSAELGS